VAGHGFTFDGVDRGVTLLLRAQAASPAPLRLADLAAEWEVSPRTVRRVVQRAVDAAAEASTGALRLEGRGQGARVWWAPKGGAARGRRADIPSLLAAIGPWQGDGMTDVADVLRRLLGQAIAEAGGGAALAGGLERRVYHQPSMPRRMRDPDALDQVLTALLHQHGLAVDRYHHPRRAPAPLVLLPWTLVRAGDGLYVVGARPERSPRPRIWALHRMEGVARRRDLHAAPPADWDPEPALGHGYGPYLGSPGRTVVQVPAGEAPWVLESPLPAQVGPPEALPDGSYRVVLGVAPHPGLRMWARAHGVAIADGRLG
jgi:hypothetical protein